MLVFSYGLNVCTTCSKPIMTLCVFCGKDLLVQACSCTPCLLQCSALCIIAMCHVSVLTDLQQSTCSLGTADHTQAGERCEVDLFLAGFACGVC